MLPKPTHLGPDYAAQFTDPSVVAAYHLRPPYPDEVFDVLADLIVDDQRRVLDVGCGTGAIARGLAPRVEQVDALDPSLGMLEKGGRLPGGDAASLTWVHGFAETASLDGLYALIVAGASVHWMEWDVVFPRFRSLLSAHGRFVIVGDRTLPNPWDADLQVLIDRFSTNREFQPYDVVEELEVRGLFRPLGRHETGAVPFAQDLQSYVESFHARNGFSRDRMDRQAADEFDRGMTALVAPYAPDGIVQLHIAASIVWGEPSPES